jgi:hypothetical protein
MAETAAIQTADRYLLHAEDAKRARGV